MTYAIALEEGVLATQALLHYAAHRLATRSGVHVTLYDTVSLSDNGVAVIEGKISAAAGASELSAVEVQRQTPPQVG